MTANLSMPRQYKFCLFRIYWPQLYQYITSMIGNHEFVPRPRHPRNKCSQPCTRKVSARPPPAPRLKVEREGVQPRLPRPYLRKPSPIPLFSLNTLPIHGKPYTHTLIIIYIIHVRPFVCVHIFY